LTAPGGGLRRVGLVIGSGGLKCAAALGLLRVLRREGIPIDIAAGCSGGSIYASFAALEWDVDHAIEINARLWEKLFTRYSVKGLASAFLPGILRFSENFGLIDDRVINASLDSAFGESRIENARIPLAIVATDLGSGEKVILSSGRIADAVRASVAIPLLLRPWSIDGRRLVDGGSSDPLPVDVAIKEGCEIILAMGFENPLIGDVSSILRIVLQTSAITVNHLLKSTFAFYNIAHHAEVIPIMPSFEKHIGLRDTHLFPEIIAEGERAAERELPYLLRLLRSGRYTGVAETGE
jgi:NTE family protein